MTRHQSDSPVSDDLLTAKEVAELLKTKEKTIRDWVYKRQIPFLKLNGLLRFRRSEIGKWIQSLDG